MHQVLLVELQLQPHSKLCQCVAETLRNLDERHCPQSYLQVLHSFGLQVHGNQLVIQYDQHNGVQLWNACQLSHAQLCFLLQCTQYLQLCPV